jgi:hypothetical protein
MTLCPLYYPQVMTEIFTVGNVKMLLGPDVEDEVVAIVDKYHVIVIAQQQRERDRRASLAFSGACVGSLPLSCSARCALGPPALPSMSLH